MPVPSHERTLASIGNLVESGEYYAAHQKYRTSAARLLKGTASEENATKAADLLFDGAKRLLQKGEKGSGVDLAKYLITTWRESGIKCGQAERDRLTQLIALCGGGDNWRKVLIDESLSWSGKANGSPAGDDDLLYYVGTIMQKEQNFPQAEIYLLSCPTRDAARALASVHHAWWTLGVDAGSPSLAGHYAARGLLAYLASQAMLAASVYLTEYIELVQASQPQLIHQTLPPTSDKDRPFVVFTVPLLNFLQLTLRTAVVRIGEPKVGQGQKGTGRAAWRAMSGKYEREVKELQDKEVKAAIAHISEVYFGIKPAGAGGNNMLADLMSGIFGGGGGGGAGGPARSGAGSRAPRVTAPGLD